MQGVDCASSWLGSPGREGSAILGRYGPDVPKLSLLLFRKDGRCFHAVCPRLSLLTTLAPEVFYACILQVTAATEVAQLSASLASTMEAGFAFALAFSFLYPLLSSRSQALFLSLSPLAHLRVHLRHVRAILIPQLVLF